MLCMLVVGWYILLFEDSIVLTCTSLIAFTSIKLVAHITVIRRMGKIFIMLNKLVGRMNQKTVWMIRKFDLFHGTAKLMFAITNSILTQIYLAANGIGQEVTATMLGIHTEAAADRTLAMIPMTVMGVAFYVFVFMLQFYASVLFIAALYAEQVRVKFTRSMNSLFPDYGMMRKYLQNYNNLMRVVNHELGILPMALLAMEFVMFAHAISFMVSNRDKLVMSPYFAMLTFGCMNFLYLWCFFHVVSLNCECRKKISVAWAIAEECAADPFAVVLSHESERMRKSLKFFLLTEKIVHLKAADSIVIEKSLVLSFFNQLIPFTVMLFTSIRELDRTVSHNKSNNCTGVRQ